MRRADWGMHQLIDDVSDALLLLPLWNGQRQLQQGARHDGLLNLYAHCSHKYFPNSFFAHLLFITGSLHIQSTTKVLSAHLHVWLARQTLTGTLW